MNPHAASKNKIEFKIKLAGVCIAVKANYKSTKEFCRSYITSEPEAFTVVIEKQDIDAERERSEREKQAERERSERKKQTEQELGRQQRQRRFEDTSDAYLETLALYRKIADRMISYNTLLFHGSVVAVSKWKKLLRLAMAITTVRCCGKPDLALLSAMQPQCAGMQPIW